MPCIVSTYQKSNRLVENGILLKKINKKENVEIIFQCDT